MLSRYRPCALAALLLAARDDRAGAFTATTRPSAGGAVRTSSITTAGRPTASRLGQSLNPDWDNGDFLSSLGGDDGERRAANDAYREQSERRREEDEWRLRMAEQRKRAEARTREQQAGRTAGSGPSPELLSKMGVGQQPQAPPQQQFSAPPNAVPPPPQQMQAPPPPPQKFFDANGNEVAVPMVRDAAGNLVPWQPPQMQQPQVQPPPPVVEPPLPPKTKQSDSVSRPVGYNPDAYTMANTADVYFAQLKQDSKVRKEAWLSGDRDKANEVFADDSVQKIKDGWRDNPYTKEKNIAEARAGIEQHQRMQARGDTAPKPSAKVSTGISYKEKLEQMKAKRRGGPAAEIPRVSTNEPPEAAARAPPEPKATEQPRATEQPKAIEQPPAPAADPPAPSKPVVTQLKGISGTGFGESVVVPPSLLAEQSGKVQEAKKPDPPAPVVAAEAVPSPASPAAARPTTEENDDVRRKVRTLQGLLLKHRGGPGFGSGRLREPEARRLESTLDDVKGILRNELGISDAAVVPEETPAAAAPVVQPVAPPPAAASAPPAASSGDVDPLAGSVACVEAVMKMYKEASSPSEREALMIPLREALMAAASQSNKVIAEADLASHRAAMEAGPPPVETVEDMPPSDMMGFPSSYKVTRPDEEEQQQQQPAAVAAEKDENEVKLREVRDALVNARGDDGRLGLRADLSSEEASDLADKIRGMKGILLDEVMSQ